MKKLLFIAAATAVALSSCSKNEVMEIPDASKSQIGFSTYVGTTTKAELVDTGFKQFYVYAYATDATDFAEINAAETISTYFAKESVARTSSDSDWASTNPQYWPVTTVKLSFFAYGSDKGTSTTAALTDASDTDGNLVYPTVGFSTTTLKGSEDLVVASNLDLTSAQDDGENDDDDANLEFSHILTKLQFAFKGENESSDITYKITKVTFTNVLPTGTYSYGATAGWTANGTAESYDYYNSTAVSFTGGSTYTFTDATAAPLMLIPQELGADNLISVTYSVYQSGYEVAPSTTKSVSLYGTEWEMGQNILYTVTLPVSTTDAKAITFTSTELKGWTTTTDSGVSLSDQTATSAATEADLDDAIATLNSYAGANSTERAFTVDALEVSSLSNSAIDISSLGASLNFKEGDTITITFGADVGDTITTITVDDSATIQFTKTSYDDSSYVLVFTVGNK